MPELRDLREENVDLLSGLDRSNNITPLKLLGINNSDWERGTEVFMLSHDVRLNKSQVGDLSESLFPIQVGYDSKYVSAVHDNHLLTELKIGNDNFVSDFDLKTKDMVIGKQTPDGVELIDKESFQNLSQLVNLNAFYLAYNGYGDSSTQEQIDNLLDDIDAKNVDNIRFSSLGNYNAAMISEYKKAMDSAIPADQKMFDYDKIKSSNEIKKEFSTADGKELTKDMVEYPLGNKEFEYFDIKPSKGVLNLGTVDGLIDATQIRQVSDADRDSLKKSGWVINEQFAGLAWDISQDIKDNKARRAAGEENVAPVSAYFIGPSGSGKTSSAEKIAEFLGLPFGVINCNSETGIEDLIVSQELIDNGMTSIYKESQLVKILETGGVILLDEVDKIGDPGVLVSLNNALSDGRLEIPSVDSPTGSKVINVHPETVVIFSGNPGHRGSKELPASVYDRTQEYGLVREFSIIPGREMKKYLDNSPDYAIVKKLTEAEVKITEADKERIDYLIGKFADAITEFNDRVYNELDSGYEGRVSSPEFIGYRDFENAIEQAWINIEYTGSFEEALREWCTTDGNGLMAKHVDDNTLGFDTFVDIYNKMIK